MTTTSSEASSVHGLGGTPQNVRGPASIIEEEQWERWFAWKPVTLYVVHKICWLRKIHRRRVTKHGLRISEYTDKPEEYPSVDATGTRLPD